ncbi:MAG TPA: hypothetical protein V6C97_05530 [Oculatellaceae cyanobacterium]
MRPAMRRCHQFVCSCFDLYQIYTQYIHMHTQQYITTHEDQLTLCVCVCMNVCM